VVAGVNYRYRLTRWALLWTSLLNEPFTILLTILPFILFKDLGASAWQISLVVALRPSVSLLSFYWNAYQTRKGLNPRFSLLVAGILARLPFLFIFSISTPGYLIFAAAIYMLFSRASIPPWMEILKRNLTKEARERLFSLSYMLGYAEGVFIGLGVGLLLDIDSHLWQILFLIGAAAGLLGVILQYRVPLRREKEELQERAPSTLTFLEELVHPWKESWKLMRSKPDFAHFHWGFMIGGAGIMLVSTVLPVFFVEYLELSHTEFSSARSLCMGLGVVISSSAWGRAMGQYRLTPLAGWVILLFALFAACLLLATTGIAWLYIAYVIYGIAQGGSHLVWHLSGPFFSGKEDSSLYSGVNVVMVGLRGMIFPFLGSLLCAFLGPLFVLGLGMVFCLYSTYFMLMQKKAPRLKLKISKLEE